MGGAIFIASERHWHSVARVLGREDLAAKPDLASTPVRAARVEKSTRWWRLGRGREARQKCSRF
jgi:hypothetical protein